MAFEGLAGSAEEHGDFGERLARLMKMAGLSRWDLARLLGETEGTVQKWLKGLERSGDRSVQCLVV